jgi:response regulator RpfG family c-di-GMP phosphodiesterase
MLERSVSDLENSKRTILAARIAQTLDVCDVLTTNRPLRQMTPSRRALSIVGRDVKRAWRDGSLVDQLEMFVGEVAPQLSKVGSQE